MCLTRHTTGDRWFRVIIGLMAVYILETHTLYTDKLQTNVLPSSSRWIIHVKYKNSRSLVSNSKRLQFDIPMINFINFLPLLLHFSEQSVAQARASVMLYNNDKKEWEHSGGSSGISRVHVYHHPVNNTYRIVGRKVQDHTVCQQLKMLLLFTWIPDNSPRLYRVPCSYRQKTLPANHQTILGF